MARLDGARFADLAADLFETLEEERFQNETFEAAFARLLGLVPNIDPMVIQAQAGDLSDQTQATLAATLTNPDGSGLSTVVTGQGGQTIVDGLFKDQSENGLQLKVLANAYIQSLVDLTEKWGRIQRGQQVRRIQRLIGTAPDPFDLALVGTTATDIQLAEQKLGAQGTRESKADIAEVVRLIDQGLKDIERSKLDRTVGTVTLRLSLFENILSQISFLISNIPVQRLGEFGGAFTRILKASTAGVERTGKRLVRQRRALGVELIKLRDQEALITTGITLSTGEILSLRNLLQGILFLTGSLEYTCKNCAFFKQGTEITDALPGVQRENATRGGVCTFSFEGKTGRPTEPGNSCKDTWGLSGNDYWTASEDVITQFGDELNKSEGDLDVF